MEALDPFEMSLCILKNLGSHIPGEGEVFIGTTSVGSPDVTYLLYLTILMIG
jgi:hypothetical protein